MHALSTLALALLSSTLTTALPAAEVRRSFKLQVTYASPSYESQHGDIYISNDAYSPTDVYFNTSSSFAGATVFTIDTKGRVVVTKPSSEVNWPVVTDANNAFSIFQPEPSVPSGDMQLNCSIPVFPGPFTCTYPQARQFALTGGLGVTFDAGAELSTVPANFNFNNQEESSAYYEQISLTAIKP